ncbi:MAG: FAD-binding protein [Arachidicoccus sp.]|nr:FAD-binding protein [Arachidicoccus sp.]
MAEEMNATLTIPIEALSAEAFAPYGWTLGQPPSPTATEPSFSNPFTDFWHAHAFQTGASGQVEFLWVNYRDTRRDIGVLEVHHLTEQAIVPLTGDIIQVVTLDDAPDHDTTPSGLRAFRVPVGLGICMRPGCWHTTRAIGTAATCLMVTRSSTTVDLVGHLQQGLPAGRKLTHSTARAFTARLTLSDPLFAAALADIARTATETSMTLPAPLILDTDVLVIGAGGAGMSAAIAAAETGARVLLADRSLIGRGGATIMAQMTVAVALGEQTEDHWTHHYQDTLAAGRGLCSEPLARILCEEGVQAIRLLDSWGVGWARADGHLTQAHAPGHDRPRCVYVDYLNTGPAVAKTLRAQVAHTAGVQRVGELVVVDLLLDAERVVGAVALHLESGDFVLVRAGASVIATGGLTRLYKRNSASLNMGGDGFALALRAGARLLDMEFVQFFPIGHLAPRLVGFDPIMWDPFRYKLGGKLLNRDGVEFVERYGNANEGGKYTTTRDAATYAIIKEVEAGRGSPAGGAYLSFRHVPETTLRAAFGPIIGRLAAAGIDLTQQMIEVAPIAHYHMGGILVDTDLATDVPGLYAAGEAVGGANGANRLSGNAITEAVAFGLRAGRSAAGSTATLTRLSDQALQAAAAPVIERSSSPANATARPNYAALIEELQTIMQLHVGPFRNDAGIRHALAAIATLRDRAGPGIPPGGAQDPVRLDALDLRNMLLVAESVARAALARTESRGAHQREDHPAQDEAWTLNQTIAWRDGQWALATQAVDRLPTVSAAPDVLTPAERQA